MIQVVILSIYLCAVGVAIWYVQFTDCLRRFEESRLNPIPQAMMQKYQDSKKHDISPETTSEAEDAAEDFYDSEAEFQVMKEQLHSYLSRYPRILVRYTQADTEEARQAILDEMRHCVTCASDNVECLHNEAESTNAVLPEDLAPLPLPLTAEAY